MRKILSFSCIDPVLLLKTADLYHQSINAILDIPDLDSLVKDHTNQFVCGILKNVLVGMLFNHDDLAQVRRSLGDSAFSNQISLVCDNWIAREFDNPILKKRQDGAICVVQREDGDEGIEDASLLFRS